MVYTITIYSYLPPLTISAIEAKTVYTLTITSYSYIYL